MKLRYFGLTFVAVVGVLIGSTVSAAEMTLEECIALALKTRASIIQSRGAEELAAAGKRSALGAFLPSLSARYSWSKTKYYDVDILDSAGAPTGETATLESSGKSISISSNMSLLDVSNFFSYASASASLERAKLDVIASEQDLVYSVKLAFYAHLASIENVSVQEEAVKRSEEQLKLIQSKFDLGSASKSDVLKQRVQSGSDQLSLLRAKNAVVTSRADLAYTIGMDPTSDVTFSRGGEATEFAGTLDEAITFGLTNSPDVLAAEKDFTASKNDLRAARSQYLPTIGGSASYNLNEPDFESKSLTYGFSINWNIFDGFRREQSITSARVFRNNSMALLSDTRNATVQSIKSAYLNIEQLKEQSRVAQETVASAEEDLKITQEKYNLGAATILDLLNAQVSLRQAETDLVQANFDLNVAVAQLENAMGKK
jgi:outer membrane protein